MTRFDYGAFDELRQSSDEVMRLRVRAATVLAASQASSFNGFGDLLRHVIPDDPGTRRRVASVLRFSFAQLEGLCYSEVDPAGLPSEPLAVLGQVLGLDREIFIELVAQDHVRFADASTEAGGRGARHAGMLDGLDALRAAWERVALDRPDIL